MAGAQKLHSCNTWIYKFQVQLLARVVCLYFSNAFSSNEDSINEVFCPEGCHFIVLPLQIFDRFGSTLYEGYGPDAAWDGTAKGLQVQEGRYVYLINYQTEYGEAKYKADEVTVRR